MALLDEKTRIKYLQELGYGSVKDFQLSVMYPKWVDGIYGPQTDNALRTAWNVHLYCKDFKTKEFKCDCGGRFCNGYPTWMRKRELIHIQTIRDHYGKPMHITSGLRDTRRNAQVGGIKGSKHTKGKAVDFNMHGVTDSLSARKSAVKYIKTLPHHGYTYGDGIDSNGGTKRNGMGVALHTDTK